jgi:hypothetical protein
VAIAYEWKECQKQPQILRSAQDDTLEKVVDCHDEHRGETKIFLPIGLHWLLHLVAVQAAEAVECGGFVTLGESWIVEDGVDEVVDGTAEDHDGLPNVH